MEGYIGTILLVAYNFTPRFWAPCNGQLLSISQNTALFALIGTTYGGDGQTTFALPDLRGRVAAHVGQGPGLSNLRIGEHGGAESVTLTQANLPPHAHGLPASSAEQTTDRAQSGAPARGGAYGSPDTISGQTGSVGAAVPVALRDPYLALQYIICVEGIFPSRA